MKKIRTIIIDDEKLARNLLKTYLEKIEYIKIISECENGFTGLKSITELKPDLIFLDVQMPKLSGFEMLELLDEIPQIIFTTAFDQFAIKAFEVNAVDYLLKPFSFERLSDAVKKVIEKMNNPNSIKIDNVNNILNGKEEIIEKVVLKHNNKIIIIPVDEIYLIEAQDDYVMIHSNLGKYLKQKTMKYFEKSLNTKDFVRIHRSSIININFMNQIELFEKDSYKVILKNGVSVVCSKSGYGNLKTKLN